MSSVALPEPTALVLTALPVEMTAVLAHMGGARSSELAGPVLCEIGQFTGSDGLSWRVVAAELGPGSIETAGAVVALAGRFRPDVLMFVGIAGALKHELKVGDVVAGTDVAWTERGKWSQDDGYLPRVKTVSLSAPLNQMARKVAREGIWTGRWARPRAGARAVVAQIASGEKVVADDKFRAWLRAVFSDAYAIDNESFALARAGEVHASAQRYVVRGISDNADGGKSDDWQQDAAEAAAAFTFELLDAYGAHSGLAPGVGRADDGSPGTVQTGHAGPGDRAEPAGHAFLCYARADSSAVDALQQALEERDVPVWRDTDSLWPGQDWRAAIRQAITGEALAFLACFSRQSLSAGRSHLWEELTLAVDQMRQRPPGVSWLIPVRLDDCEVPDFELGGGRSLASIQRADLFGDRYEQNLAALVTAVRQVLPAAPAARMAATAGTPEISGVLISGKPGSYTVTIDGSGFGIPARSLPHHGTLPNFRIAVSAQIGHGEWGYTGDANLLRYQAWADRRVVVAGLSASPGDALVLALWNDQTKRGVSWGGNIPPVPSSGPVIEDVVFSGTPGNTAVTIRGRGFGPAPQPMPYTGYIPSLGIGDWRMHPEGAGPSSTWTDGITCRFAAWTDELIKVEGFAGTFGQGPNVIENGDPLTIQVWSTLGPYPVGPQTAWGGRFRTAS